MPRWLVVWLLALPLTNLCMCTVLLWYVLLLIDSFDFFLDFL
jgi:hypothetical protein